MAVAVGCVTTANHPLLYDKEFVTLKEMAYVAALSKVFSADTDEVKTRLDEYAKVQGYTGWKDVANKAVQDLIAAGTNDVPLPPQVRSELETVIRLFTFYYGHEAIHIFEPVITPVE